MTLQEKIRKGMEAKHLNQKQLAERSGITEASISKYLSGERKPRTDAIIKIAKALGESINYLLDDEPAPDSPYVFASMALARCKERLTDEEKKQLIRFLLED